MIIIPFCLDYIFSIESVIFTYLLSSNPIQENSTVIEFGSSFIFESNQVSSRSFFILDIHCENLFIGIILFFKADIHFYGDNSLYS